MESKDKPYQGDKTKASPYNDTPVLQMGPGSCDRTSCGYFPLAKVKLHNPTNKPATASTHCKIFLGEWEAGKNQRENVVVKPSGSKLVEIQFNLDVPGNQESTVGINCDVYWK